jgi:subtilisin family serine protease/uncharacterized membrane protein
MLIFILLVCPSFAGDYIITKPQNSHRSTNVMSVESVSDLSAVELNPIYGTNEFSATLTDEQVSAMASQGYNIYPNLEIHAFLSESVPQIKVPPVWNMSVNGINLTGIGQTICLIDSGIDDSNAAFGGGWSAGNILAGWAYFTNGSTPINSACNATNHSACLDDYGHGTAVAGILISNDSTYQGVAPGAKLVVVKALNSAGFGSLSDLIQGINYCVNVSGNYNISVISMSLGTSTNSSTYCDDAVWLDPALKIAVDNATSRNISIISASGNAPLGQSGSQTNISAPACLSNATPVSSVDKSDIISSWADYWSLPILFAPGEDIYTTDRTVGFTSEQGTSFAAPHVAGVFALMRQYLLLTNQTKTPSQLKSIAISTGKNLSVNHNQSRIDALGFYLNVSYPPVLIAAPADNSFKNSSLLIVDGNSPQDGTNISVFNSTGGLVNYTASNGTTWSANFTLVDGLYNIAAIVSNGSGTTNATVSNLTIDTRAPSLTINSPSENSSLNATTLTINLTSTDANLNYTNISLINSTGSFVSSVRNSTNGTYEVTLSVALDGVYTINATSYDLAGNMNFSAVRNISVIAPARLKIRPSWNNTYYEGNSTLSAGETEGQNNSRNLYCNLNQMKTILFYVNNSGTNALQNLTAAIYGFSGLNITLSWHNGSNASIPENVSSNSSAILNLTIFSPIITFNYTDSGIYLNSSNGYPYTDLNLSLGFVVTNQTLPILSNPNNIYYFGSGNQTTLNFSVYFYDNQTVDNLLIGNYSSNLTNSTIDAQLTFNVSGGVFFTQLNTTNLSEGNYTLQGNFNDTSNNTVSLNLTFQLLQNINLDISTNQSENPILKNQNFTLSANVSQNSSLPAGNGTICLQLPSLIQNNTGLCQNFTNLSSGSPKLNNWTLKGLSQGNFTINITAYSADGRFNKTSQKNVTISYGELNLSWKDASNYPPTEIAPSQTFHVKTSVTNRGNIDAINVSLDLSYSGTYFSYFSGSSDPCITATLSPGESRDCDWTLASRASEVSSSEIRVTVSAGNATLPSPTYIARYMDIIAPSQEEQTQWGSGNIGSNSSTNQTTNISSALSFTNPTNPSLILMQGQNYTLLVSVKNTGVNSLTNLYLEISGLDSSALNIDSNDKTTLSSGNSRSFNVYFSIPPTMEAKKYNLAIKAVSDQASWSKAIELQINGVLVEFTGLENISVTPGESSNFTFYLKNSGYKSLNNLKISLGGIEPEKYSVTPVEISILNQNASQNFTLSIILPSNETLGQKDVNLLLIGDEGNFSKNFVMNILPSQEERNQIIETYQNLFSDFQKSLDKYRLVDHSKINASQIDEQMNITNQTMLLINSSLERGDYIEAKRLISQAQESLNQLETNLADTKDTPPTTSIFLMVVLAFGLVLVAVAFFYAFISKKEKSIGSIIVEPKTKTSPSWSIKNYFAKSPKKSGQELQREKILEEWRQRYELRKKNKPYDE